MKCEIRRFNSNSGYKNIVFQGTFMCLDFTVVSHLSLILFIIVLGRAVPSQPLLVELKE